MAAAAKATAAHALLLPQSVHLRLQSPLLPVHACSCENCRHHQTLAKVAMLSQSATVVDPGVTSQLSYNL